MFSSNSFEIQFFPKYLRKKIIIINVKSNLEKLKEKFNIYDNKWYKRYGIEIINKVIGTNEIIDVNKERREIEHILGFTDAHTIPRIQLTWANTQIRRKL
jgi:hypothetical protein